jgi:hypothetical protein
MENQVTEMLEVNGKNLTAEDQPRPEGRRYCDTCRFSQLVLSQGNGMMICRRYPATIIGAASIQNVAGQQQLQWLTSTQLPGVSREDWCGEHQPDPRGARIVPANNDSKVIAQQ